MTGVMDGIRILEVAEHTFVPAAAAVLADWGADVIKIEHVERGDAMRGIGNSPVINLGDGRVHALLEHSNRGKRSLGLDLTQPEGLEILYALAATSDVFLTNKLPHVRTRLAIDLDDIRAQNPDIIYVRGSGFGARGPDADHGGYDALAFWARSGNAMGAKPLDRDGITMMPAPAYGDSIGAMTIAGGISAALFHRQRTGVPEVVDVSLLATGLWAIGASVALSLYSGSVWQQPPTNMRELSPNALSGLYRTSDDRWLMLNCLQGFHYWPAARAAFDLEHLGEDERFDSAASFAANSPALAVLLAEIIAARPLAHWKEQLRSFSGQWAPVQDCAEVADDPQVKANGYILETENAAGVPFRLVSAPVQFGDQPAQPGRAPEFNEHGDALLADELGLDPDAILELKVKGVVP